MAKISIITPTYNSSNFIKKTIESVLSQTFSDWEYLIVDDNSTDNTEEIVKSFTEKDHRIKFIKNKTNSGGPATPKNTGIMNSTGEYIAFLDHDDEWLPEKLKKQSNLFESSNNKQLGLVSCYINVLNDKNKLLFRYKNLFRNDVLKEIISYDFMITSSSIMIKKSVFDKIGLFDVSLKKIDDYDMYIRISNSGFHYDFVPEYLVNYIQHKGNISSKTNNNNDFKKELIIVFEKYNNLFDKYGLKQNGHYFFYKNEYKIARKFFFLSILSKRYNWEQKIKSLSFIILTFIPSLENKFRKIFIKIKHFYSLIFK